MTQVLVALGLVAGALGLVGWLRLGIGRELAVAALRAAVQLAVVGAVVTAIFDSAGLGAAFVAVMACAATVTSGRRLRGVPGAWVRAGAAILAGALTGLVPLLVAGAFSTRPRELVPVAGILIGGAMVAASVTGSRLVASLREGVADVEARLALGVPASEAVAPRLRGAIVTGVVPVMDQTKNAGLVTLPGTFVGLVLGGASPAEAARVQLTVLLALLAVELVAALVVARLVVAGLTLPGERVAVPGEG